MIQRSLIALMVFASVAGCRSGGPSAQPVEQTIVDGVWVLTEGPNRPPDDVGLLKFQADNRGAMMIPFGAGPLRADPPAVPFEWAALDGTVAMSFQPPWDEAFGDWTAELVCATELVVVEMNFRFEQSADPRWERLANRAMSGPLEARTPTEKALTTGVWLSFSPEIPVDEAPEDGAFIRFLGNRLGELAWLWANPPLGTFFRWSIEQGNVTMRMPHATEDGSTDASVEMLADDTLVANLPTGPIKFHRTHAERWLRLSSLRQMRPQKRQTAP